MVRKAFLFYDFICFLTLNIEVGSHFVSSLNMNSVTVIVFSLFLSNKATPIVVSYWHTKCCFCIGFFNCEATKIYQNYKHGLCKGMKND